MRIEATRIDPITGERDPHGIPQIACPGCRSEVNPQFTCLRCPCALEMETHQAVDDRGGPYYLVDVVECGFEGESRALPAQRQQFPTLLAGLVEGAPPRVGLGVVCPLLSWPGQSAPLLLEIEGEKWVPVGNCRTCQFYRGVEGVLELSAADGESRAAVLCASPLAPSQPLGPLEKESD